MKTIKLTKEQESFIEKEFLNTPDLLLLTRKCFKNDKLDGRDMEGRAVRKFLLDKGLKFSIRERAKAKDVILTDEQKEDIIRLAQSGTKLMDICKIIFPENEKVEPLSKEFRVIAKYLESIDESLLNRDVTDEYRPPSTIKQLIGKVQEATGIVYYEDKLTKFDEENFQLLKKYLKSPRLNETMNRVYNDKGDRRLAEQELIRTVWDKMDLNHDELNNCISLVMLYVSLVKVEEDINKLREIFKTQTDDEEGKNMAMKLNDAIKVKTEERAELLKRQESFQKSLNQSRGERLKQQKESNASILSLVKNFQQEEGRENMRKMAELEAQMAEKEVGRLESMSDFKARILGIGRKDAV